MTLPPSQQQEPSQQPPQVQRNKHLDPTNLPRTVRAPRAGQHQFLAQSANAPISQNADASTTKYYTLEEVAAHNKSDDAWMVLEGIVYDITDYLSAHPGGSSILLKFAGKDATRQFNAVHPWVSHRALLQHRVVGYLAPK